MVMSAVVSPQGRRSIRDAVFQYVVSYNKKTSSCNKKNEYGMNLSEDEEEMMQVVAERTKNVLILMCDTGGGHRASAEAIKDTLHLLYGDEYRVFVKDLCKEHAGWPINNMDRSYKFFLKHNQLWKVAFHGTSPRWVHCGYLAAIAAFYAKKVEAGIKKYKPDIIISVHPLMQHIPLWVLKRQSLSKKVIFITVITDLNTCHPTWFHIGVTRCYCPSEEVSKRAVLDGLDQSQIRVFGLPIRPSFCRANILKDSLRGELEMDQHLPAVLLMGGGEGIGPVKETAIAIGESLYNEETGKQFGQLVVVCGRNQTLRSTLQEMDWKIPVKIRGFETQMEKWMEASDCIVTKGTFQLPTGCYNDRNCFHIHREKKKFGTNAGPGTIAEALIKGLPIILNDFIPGQEVGNIPYVVDNGAGVFSKSPKDTAQLVAQWFGPDSKKLKTMSENALRLAKPNAVVDIVKDINDLVRRRGPLS